VTVMARSGAIDQPARSRADATSLQWGSVGWRPANPQGRHSRFQRHTRPPITGTRSSPSPVPHVDQRTSRRRRHPKTMLLGFVKGELLSWELVVDLAGDEAF